ncbi:hypothetical protein SAMN05421820_10618 [Pedobacter steynii]|uniref:Uncharacterized protein n=1 Tax=Pedobacter steynii TaxID=430522 RepID=A0A1G9Y7Q5_9SPHI|nr:DUF6266 family protein [Pedobacter steynii]NQX39623.1 hypothetical protein [Pedobacter steynii]SDN04676.1 hypothetical protein SAMN05421820_10618 [Pedobacter steynii]
MGKLINGLFGGFQGRVGNLVGYTLKGKHIIRMIGKTEKPLTPARRANCEKMKVVNEILKPSIHAIRAGFRLAVIGTDRNEYNEAVSYNKKNALQGVYPNISLDYTKVLMSMGSLPIAVNPSISQNGTEITFNWEISASPVSQYHTDRSMLVIYFPDIKETCCQLIGAKRVEGKDVVIIGAEHINQRMEAYITFIKDNGKAVSNSVYAGSLNTIKASLPDISTTEQKNEVKDAIATSPNESEACEHYIVKDKMTQKPIGNCVLRHNQDNFQIVEIGIKISPTAQSEEATLTMMSYIFVRKE